jgi:hypothetical protein
MSSWVAQAMSTTPFVNSSPGRWLCTFGSNVMTRVLPVTVESADVPGTEPVIVTGLPERSRPEVMSSA